MANLKTGVSRKQSTPNFPKNEHFLPPYKKCSFFGKFGVLCFLQTAVLRFAILPYYRRVIRIGILRKKIVERKSRKEIKNYTNFREF